MQNKIKKIEKFMENLKDSRNLKQSHNKFFSTSRDFVYKLVSKNIKEDMPLEEIVDYLKLFLQDWNRVMYQRLKRSVKERMHSEILKVYKNNIKKIQKLPEKIEDIDLDKNRGLIIKLFNNFAACESIKYTGASKLLHLLKPNLFPLWDKNIKHFYHGIHPKEKDKKYKGECYFNFMKQIQKIVLSISEEEKSKLSNMPNKNTIIRIIDCYNYVNITRTILNKLKKKSNNKIS